MGTITSNVLPVSAVPETGTTNRLCDSLWSTRTYGDITHEIRPFTLVAFRVLYDVLLYGVLFVGGAAFLQRKK